MQYNPVELILKKRNGHVLSEAEITFFIEQYLQGKIRSLRSPKLISKAASKSALPRICRWQISILPVAWATRSR